jgi:hypothetical protein
LISPDEAKVQLLAFAERHDAAKRLRRRPATVNAALVVGDALLALKVLGFGARRASLGRGLLRAAALARVAAPLVPIVVARLRASRANRGVHPNGRAAYRDRAMLVATPIQCP